MRSTLYEELYRELVSRIKTGDLPPSSRMPSVRKCAEEKGIGINTVISAYNLLLSEGYIVSKPQSGYYVAEYQGLETGREVEKMEGKEEEKSRGEMLSLSANLIDSSLFPFSTLRQLYREALSGKDPDLLEKSGSNLGDRSLREEIARLSRLQRGVECTWHQVVVGNGTTNHLQLLPHLFPSPVTFLVETPGNTSTREVLSDSGAQVVSIGVDEEGATLRDIRRGAKGEGVEVLLISPSHQFPMGSTMSAPRRADILRWAYEREGRYILEDDYDSDFRYNGHPIPSLASLDNRGRVIYMGTFSRTLTPTLRISYMILPPGLLEEYRGRFRYYPCPVSRIEQSVLSAFMAGGYYERHVSRMRRIYRQRRGLMLSLLAAAFPGLEVKGEEAGLHFIVSLPTSLSEEEIVARSREKGMETRGTGNGWIIIGYAHLSEEEMKRAVDILKEVSNA